MTTHLVASNKTNALSYNEEGGQKSNMNLMGLKSKCQQGCAVWRFQVGLGFLAFPGPWRLLAFLAGRPTRHR